MINYAGSSWAKWDLHVHTPESYSQSFKASEYADVWEQYILDLENLPPEFKVIGINDYVLIEGYKRVLDYKRRGRLSNIDLIVPVMEFRIKKFAGRKDLKKINFHVIFSDDINPNLIEQQFLSALPSKYQLSPDAEEKGIYWSGIINKNSIEDFGRKIKETVPKDKLEHFGSDFNEGITNLNIDEKDIIEILEKSSYFNNKYLFTIGKTEWADLSWADGTIGEKKDIINKVHFIFSASESVESHSKAKKILTEQKVNNRLLDCSDAHHNLDSQHKDRIGNCFTWIKSDICFEGLKQILHESETRLQISNSRPLEPIRKIVSLEIDLPENISIKNKLNTHSEGTIFCWAGKKTLFFSPYFTCIIGGRGSGKSALLSLIALKSDKESEFFNKNDLLIDGVKINVNDYINIQGSTSDIEFINQNEIENYANNNSKLTEAIYKRVLQITSETSYKQMEIIVDAIKSSITEIDEIIANKKAIAKKRSMLKQLNKELKDHQNVIDSFRSGEYKAIADRISTTTKKMEEESVHKKQYTSLLTDLSSILKRYNTSKQSVFKNEYYNLTVKILQNINSIIEGSPNPELIVTPTVSLEAQIKELHDELNEFLRKQGLSIENSSDYNKALSQKPIIENNIALLESEIIQLDLDIEKFNRSEILNSKTKFENLIRAELQPLNEQLISSNSNVKNIVFKYVYDNDEAKKGLFADFQKEFYEYNKNTRADSLKDYLFHIEPRDVTSREQYLESLGKYGSDSTNAKSISAKIFEEDVNFDIYKLLIVKHMYDCNKYKKIIGFYGDKDLNSCSFGQKCTAVIVALLTFGNKPLLIDEPEAHLDSRLIAEYLVELIKRKKTNRQVIFAAHNANFVVNGDAELIHCLEIDESNCTHVVSTSIENTSHREKILALEGGQKAFEMRERRLLL